MTPILAILAAVFVVGAVLGAYALLAPRAAVREEKPLAPLQPLDVSTNWTTEAGQEFGGLSESARCDLIFAVVDLDDERSRRLLEHALQDPSEAVALAAAHALVRRGAGASVEEFAQRHPGERSERLARTLELLN
jgi:HEAT repeat protein